MSQLSPKTTDLDKEMISPKVNPRVWWVDCRNSKVCRSATVAVSEDKASNDLLSLSPCRLNLLNPSRSKPQPAAAISSKARSSF